MDLRRTPLLFETSVPVNWPKRVGMPAPGMTRKKRTYPAGGGKPGVNVGVDEYDCTPEGKKIAKSHAWQFLKPVKVCGKTIKY